MTLISMAVFDQDGSGRTEITKKTLDGLLETVDFYRHRMFIIDNASCYDTKDVIAKFAGNFSAVGKYPMEQLTVITNDENLGTAAAVNMGLRQRREKEHCIKMDNDVIVYQQHWIDEMERAIEMEPKIGILGLKRKDLEEWPGHPNPHFRSKLFVLGGELQFYEHKPGEQWQVNMDDLVIFEQIPHGVMGTCTMFNWRLMDKIGYLYQPTLYGWDDGLISTRSKIAGFVNGFLPHIEIDHIDPGTSFYQKWKEDRAAEAGRLAAIVNQEYLDGVRDIYEP